jgi:hypothetical protein
VTNSLTFVVLCIAQAFGPLQYYPLFFAAYAVGIVIVLFIACYRAWDDERTAKEKVFSDASVAAAAKLGVPSDEWRKLSEKFEAKTNTGVTATWTHESYSGRNDWALGGPQRDDIADSEQLCRLAGKLLGKSVQLKAELGRQASTDTDSLRRWLNYLRENHNAVGDQIIGGPQVMPDGQENWIVSGSIRNLARVSARVCMHCVEREL